MSRAPAFFCAGLLLAASCGGSGARPLGDAATTDAPASVPTTCELATQSPCGATEQCSPFCEGDQLVVGCRAEPATPVPVGGTCGATMICERGSTCLAAAMMPIQCMKLCGQTTDCPAGKGCRDVKVTYPCGAGSQMVTLRACL